MSDAFIGTGWAFPVKTDATGGIALVSGDENVEESIRLILATAPGERQMRPEFGCGIHDHAFASISAGTIGRIAQDVRQALLRWEPRIDVRDVEVTPDTDEPSRLFVHVFYAIRNTNDPRNLVFPFYFLPSEPPAPAGSPPSQ